MRCCFLSGDRKVFLRGEMLKDTLSTRQAGPARQVHLSPLIPSRLPSPARTAWKLRQKPSQLYYAVCTPFTTCNILVILLADGLYTMPVK